MRPLVLACVIFAAACSTHSNAMHLRDRMLIENNHETRVEVRIGMTSSTAMLVGRVDPSRTKTFALPYNWSEYIVVVTPVFGGRYETWQRQWAERLTHFVGLSCVRVRVALNMGATTLMRC